MKKMKHLFIEGEESLTTEDKTWQLIIWKNQWNPQT